MTDDLNITVGCSAAASLGLGSWEDQTVVENGLRQWRSGQKDDAVVAMSSHGISLTHIYTIVSAAIQGEESDASAG